MGILAGQGGFAQTAGAESGGDHAAPAHPASAALRAAAHHEGVQGAEFPVTADEVLMAAHHVARGEVGQGNAVEPGGDAVVEGVEALGEGAEVIGLGARGALDLGGPLGGVQLAQDLRSAGEPRLKLAVGGAVAAMQVGQPGRQALIVPRAEVSGGDEEDGGDAVIAARGGMLAAEVFLPFPEAVGAVDVVGGKEGEEEARGAQPLAERALPVAPLLVGVGVKEDAQLAPGVAPVAEPQLAIEGGDPAFAAGVLRLVVFAGVGEKEVIVSHSRRGSRVKRQFDRRRQG